MKTIDENSRFIARRLELADVSFKTKHFEVELDEVWILPACKPLSRRSLQENDRISIKSGSNFMITAAITSQPSPEPGKRTLPSKFHLE